MKTDTALATSFVFVFLICSIIFTASMMVIYFTDKPAPKRAAPFQFDQCTVVGKANRFLDVFVLLECKDNKRYAVSVATFKRALNDSANLPVTDAKEAR